MLVGKGLLLSGMGKACWLRLDGYCLPSPYSPMPPTPGAEEQCWIYVVDSVAVMYGLV